MISTIYQSYGNTLAHGNTLAYGNTVPMENQLPLEIDAAIKHTIARVVSDHGPVKVFFRADDIGVPSKNYTRMMSLFLKYQTPLCLAVVPVWMTRQRWEAMADFVKIGSDLFCWHMHGFRHKNHEIKGKKQEFGPARLSRELSNDLEQGHARLQNIMGEWLTPIFTPPWNRCSLETMTKLKAMGFKGVSRSHGSLPSPPKGFKDFPIHVDLHTRKEKQAKDGWKKLLEEFETGMKLTACGIMIHHMRMNDPAFVFLEYLLELIAKNKQIKTITYKDLLLKS